MASLDSLQTKKPPQEKAAMARSGKVCYFENLKLRNFRLSNVLYFDTAANRSECNNDWNFLSSVLKCICRFELSEFTDTLSRAIFSVGVAVILRYRTPALTRVERV